MKALVLDAFGKYPELKEADQPLAKADQVVLRVKATGLNRRDFYITQGMYPGVSFPVILGSDVCAEHEGKDVIVNPNINWGEREEVQAEDYHILGMPSNGGMAEYVAVGRDRIHPKPEHLSVEQAAALPLGGLTAYRAVFTKGNLKKGEKILINGIGGGVATLAFQYALAIGAEVYVTSSSSEKLAAAMELGAKGSANYTEENWHKQLAKDSGGFDLIIDSAGGKGFANLAKLCRPAARIVFYGGTRGKIEGLSPQILFWRQVSIHGSTMGSDKDFEAMLDFVKRHKIVPIVDAVYEMEDADQAFESMKQSTQMGKIVLRISSDA